MINNIYIMNNINNINDVSCIFNEFLSWMWQPLESKVRTQDTSLINFDTERRLKVKQRMYKTLYMTWFWLKKTPPK